MSTRTLIRTTAFRLTAIYMGAFIAFSVVIFGYISYNVTQRLSTQLNQAIENETQGLSRHYRQRGIRGLLNHVERRSRQPGSAALLVTNFQGVGLTGNIPSLPPDFLRHSRGQLHPLPYERRNVEGDLERHVAMVRIYDLPGGFHLIVGRDIGEREEFKRVMFGFIVIALGALAVLGFLSWVLVGRRVLRRIDGISATSRAIVEGDLSGRLAIDGSGDEFDRLALHVNNMLDRIEALILGLKDVSDNIAHDLKTPLTRMRSRVEATLSSKGSVTEMRQALEATISESDQLIRTFDALLKIARVEAGTSIALDNEVDLTTLVNEVAELYEPVAEEAGVAFEVEATSGPATIAANRELLAQACANLIDNAIKYAAREALSQSDEAGDASLDDETAHVSVSLQHEGDSWVISVADNGPGIPTEELGNVTKRFVRLEKSRSKPGNGLGLSLVKAVAKLHSGKLELSDNNPGLLVRLCLPKNEGARVFAKKTK